MARPFFLAGLEEDAVDREAAASGAGRPSRVRGPV